jgi:hypothetical protein
MTITQPEGISEGDYEAIEAAVVETVRGRWFLAEYARRSRVDEVRQMLDGLARLEQTVREQHLPADPSIRLIVQRLRDVSQTLESLVADMRADGVGEQYCRDIEAQARAVGGLFRSAPQVKADVVKADSVNAAAPKVEAKTAPLPAPLPPPAPVVVRAPDPPPVRPAPQVAVAPRAEPGALKRLDRLSTAEKVALFT